jgi:enamine deaminase RidA (YjgF/YER057c/UK114 family)
MSRRRSIDIPGLSHGPNPIPQAAVVGNLLVSGGVMGMEPDTHEMPDDLPAQCRLMFANIRRIMEAAGGTTEDIVKLTVFLKPGLPRDALNQEWVAMFPDPASRPARHTLVYDLPMGMLIQCEIIAMLEG